MLNINPPEDTNTSNILRGFTIFLSICPKTKIISHSGAIDVVLMNNTYTQENLNSLVLLGWEELSNYSWRYYLENPWRRLNGKFNNDPQFDEVLAYISQDRKDLDEEIGRYYDQEYQIIEERMYDQ